MRDLQPFKLIPDNDAERLEKLREYKIVSTHSEDNFDKIAYLAKQIFNTPNAFISFVDENSVFFKSNLSSLPTNQVPREESLCSYCILKNDVTVYSDTHTHEELMHIPLVVAEGGIRFYAGAPLRTPEGFNMGSICVVDSKPYNPTQLQLDMLTTLSKIIVDKLENRLRYRKSLEAQMNFMDIALHEIKNPLASIKLANDILRQDSTKEDKMTDMIKSSVTSIQAKLSEFLKQSELEDKEMLLAIEPINLNDLFKRLIANFDLLANRKNQELILECADSLPKLYADKVKILDVLHNLLSNAIKYSYKGSTIRIIAKETDGYITIEIQDEGQGLDKNDLEKLFTKFAKLSSKPTGKETSNGLGLSIVKAMVELHNGTIEAYSPGKDKGTSFIVTLPLVYQNEPQPVFS
ncbi:MAG: GAF domain-containing sensor histidine kinase [Flavobacterium sp.]|nr:MAG: GAF domain-containing sensor histidine kinase [Flavobacterium sp.]